MDQVGDALRLTLTGALDEYADFSQLDLKSVKTVVIDLDGVFRCNSMGVLRWGHFLKALPRDLKIVLVRCSPVLVKQFNLFTAFLSHPGVEVESFFVSYVCETCETTSENVLLNTSALAASGIADVATRGSCPTCSQELTLEEWPNKQFLFLIRQGRVRPASA